MRSYNLRDLTNIAQYNKFNWDTLEKVFRLSELLKLFNENGSVWFLNRGLLYHMHTNKLHTNHIANLVMTRHMCLTPVLRVFSFFVMLIILFKHKWYKTIDNVITNVYTIYEGWWFYEYTIKEDRK